MPSQPHSLLSDNGISILYLVWLSLFVFLFNPFIFKFSASFWTGACGLFILILTVATVDFLYYQFYVNYLWCVELNCLQLLLSWTHPLSTLQPAFSPRHVDQMFLNLNCNQFPFLGRHFELIWVAFHFYAFLTPLGILSDHVDLGSEFCNVLAVFVLVSLMPAFTYCCFTWF